MKKSIIIIIGIFLILFSFVIFFRIFTFDATRSGTNKKIVPLETISFGSGQHKLTLYLDYNSKSSREFFHIFSDLFASLLSDNMVTLRIHYVPQGDQKYAGALYCSYAVGKHMQYSQSLLENYRKIQEGDTIDFTQIAIALGVKKSTFEDCMNAQYFAQSIHRDMNDFITNNLKILPAIVYDDSEMPLQGLSPGSLSEYIYRNNIQQNTINEVVPPPGGWHREDGGSGNIDSSIPTQSRKWNTIK